MKRFKFSLFAILAVTIVTCLILAAWINSSLPKTNGQTYVTGISGNITIARDSRGIPHISAATDNDLHFGMGYVHAQDRLWQMTMNRSIGRGELASIIGDAGVKFDKYFRTLGFLYAAEKAYSSLDSETQASLQAYADGVNAFLDSHKGALPPEFLLTGTEPVRWSPVDSLIWMKMMALDLSGNMKHEIARARLLTKVSPTALSAIYPTYAGDTEAPFPDLYDLYKDLPLEETALAVGGEPPAGYGSNNWVVSGAHTKSGKPMLANDPHLSLSTPSIWYLAHSHNTATNRHIVGVSFPGAPSIVLGHNGKIAWGFTNTYPDTQDLFIEKLIGENDYLTPDGPAQFKTRTESITVKDADPVVITVRETRHGPVISDIVSDTSDFVEDGYVLALQWTALMDKDTGIAALLKLGNAQNFKDFQETGKLYMGPEQNMVYADTDGNIGYYAPALVPIRHLENTINGRLPSPGWDARYDWQGYIPYDELPTRYNPDSGIIATANEKIVPDTYKYFITRDWSLPYRGNRIRQTLASTNEHDVSSFTALQGDIVSDMARDILPSLIAALSGNDYIRDTLAAWDGSMDKNRPEPLIFELWISKYQQLFMQDELGDMYEDFSRIRPQLVKSSLYWSLPAEKRPENDAYYNLPIIKESIALGWCDDKRTSDRRETCLRYAYRAMTSVIEDLTGLYGSDTSNWKWGTEHVLHQKHRPFSEVAALKNYFELSAPVSGGRYTVNVSGVDRNERNRHGSSFGPSYRGIFDLSNLNKSRFIQPTGQSGNVLSKHYDDLFEDWLNVQSFEIPYSSSIPEDAVDILTLRPRQ